ncbi:MAG TPA: AarF/UbiB family protein [Anaerolineaceae bacterium]|jgi:predicted unusual protein kinase regulating ubiquinone biosynthesis (AarF/ABC1/UbiB family)|nr:AarF/UbiB family protein [Anaerolineaceae bacterium]HQO97954.1 AarF/UbiB family protein [Anaerolineaceae bacterium]HQP61469.1 AarF/UbiB family protein [Anaerolineaceae bacterium]
MLKSRYRRILWFFARVLVNLLFWDVILSSIGLRRISHRTRARRLQKIAASFRTLAIEMSGVMIKVGQFLSARLDVLPREIIDELAGLQDEVRPEPVESIRAVVEAEFHCPLEELFTDFNPQPMAAASIGQVHTARLQQPDGTFREVVVKVQRPNIPQVVETDLAALRVVARWVHHYKPIRRHVNVPLLVEEFSRTLLEEIDYIHEGRNAEQFAKNFQDRPEVQVPAVYWTHTTLRVLTLENVLAIKITDNAALDAAGVDRAAVADTLIDIYLQQIFEDYFFHADPHPGNLFILPTAPPDPATGRAPWRVVFVDFGMTGTLPPNLQAGLREVLIGIGTQDTHRLIQAYQTMELLLPNADLPLLEKATNKVFQRFWGKSTAEMMNMKHAEAVEFVQEFSDLVFDMPFQAPENMVLLARCLGILSGICSGLNPDFNVWTSIGPYAQKLVQAEAGSGWRFWLDEALGILSTLATLPRKTDALIRRVEGGEIEVRTPELRRDLNRLERSNRKLTAAILFAASLLGAVQLYLADARLPAYGLGGLAGLILLWIVFSR